MELDKGMVIVDMLYSSMESEDMGSIGTGKATAHNGVGIVTKSMYDGIEVGDRVIIDGNIKYPISRTILIRGDSLIKLDCDISNIEASIVGSDVSTGIILTDYVESRVQRSMVLIVGSDGIGIGAAISLDALGAIDITIADSDVDKINFMEGICQGPRLLINKIPIYRKAMDITGSGYDIVIVTDSDVVDISDMIKCTRDGGECIVYKSRPGSIIDCTVVANKRLTVIDRVASREEIKRISHLVSRGRLPIIHAFNGVIINSQDINSIPKIVLPTVGKLLVKCFSGSM